MKGPLPTRTEGNEEKAGHVLQNGTARLLSLDFVHFRKTPVADVSFSGWVEKDFYKERAGTPPCTPLPPSAPSSRRRRRGEGGGRGAHRFRGSMRGEFRRNLSPEKLTSGAASPSEPPSRFTASRALKQRGEDETRERARSGLSASYSTSGRSG
jgi:hypothetical protein